MAQLVCWPTLNGQPTGSGPFPAVGGQIVLTEISQFSTSSIILPAANERAILAMAPYTLIEVEQEGVGTICSGYVLNPKHAITDRDESTITIDLAPLTVECTWEGTHRGWIAQNYLSTIAARLGSLTPGWAGSFTDIYTPADILVSVSLGDGSVLAGFLDTAKQFSQYARLGVDATGVPIRVLEMGQFGAPPTVTLVSGNGGDADAMTGNGVVRLVATVDAQPNDVESLTNVTVPFGGGSSSDTLVTLERLWRLMNDATYPGAGLWGDVPGSRFPEYDPAYPIDNPRNRANGAPTFVNGVLDDKGAYGSRYATLDGHWDYMVYDRDSYFGTATTPAYGHKWTPFVDSSLTYADNSVANQELTARALYVSTIANFKRFAHPHHLFTCTTPGVGRPTRAGDLISVDYQRVSVGDTGAVVEMDVREPGLRVMSVVRAFNGDTPPVDTYTLSNLGRFDATDATGQANTAQQLVALQINQSTGLAKDSVTYGDNVDALNPMTIWHYIASEHFRYHQVRVRCDFFPFRGTATTAQNQAGTHIIAVGGVDIALPTPADINALAANIGGVPTHYHNVGIVSSNTVGGGAKVHIASTPTDITPDRYVWVGGDGFDQISLIANGHQGSVRTGQPEGSDVNLMPTSHPHVVAKAKDIIAHIPAGTDLADLPLHTHDVEKRIPTGQPAPAAITLSINGQNLSSGAASTGTRNPNGSFGSSFVVENIGPYLDAFAAGTDVPLAFSAETSASNPFGVGYIVVTVTAVEELGGLSSTVRAQ